jgi:3-isopropylmalate/(R)-2-methylmalate dehydratase small subunit
MTQISGRVWAFGHSISADNGIIQYSNLPDLGSFDIPALKSMCFTLLDPDFPQKVRAGDIIVAGRSFGHHSHPHACVAMHESGIVACVCDSTDSAFIRKGLNIGLPVIPCAGVSDIAATGDEIELDLATGALRNRTTGAMQHFRPFCREMLDVWRNGGLAPALREWIAAEATS